VEMNLTVEGKSSSRTFQRRDQFAPELIYFSDCILRNKEPEPSGLEGLMDIRVLEAVFKSARQGSAVKLGSLKSQKTRPTKRQEIRRPPVREPELVQAQSASLE